MSEPKAIHIPQLNPNETEVHLASLPTGNGKAIRAGDVLATFETTKSTIELIADTDGFVIGLNLNEGDSAFSGDIFCYIGESPTDPPPLSDPQKNIRSSAAELGSTGLPVGLRISKPALILAQQNNLDLANLPRGPLVTVSDIKTLLHLDQLPIEGPSQPSKDLTALIIYGGGGHGKSLIDLIRTLGTYQLAGIIDDGLLINSQIMGVPVLGGSDSLEKLSARGIQFAINAVGGIGNIRPRLTVFKRLEETGFSCPTVVHPRAFIEGSATLEGGCQVFPFAYVGSSVQMGYGVIANTGSIISHDCVIEKYANISPGAILAGGVKIGERSLIGMGVTINLGVSIGADTRIGNGATIKEDVPPGSIVHAGSIWPPIR